MRFRFDAVKDVLRCPKCRSELIEAEGALVCVDPACRLRFQIRDGIPILLADDATELSPDEWRTLIEKHAPSLAADRLTAGNGAEVNGAPS